MSTNDPQRPRSTPIPGGDFLNAPAPTTGEFLGSPSPVPPGQFPGQVPSPGSFGQVPPPGGGAPFGQFGGAFPGGPVPTQIFVPKKRRSGCGLFVAAIVILSTLGGIGAAVWGVMQAQDAIERSDDLSNPELSGGDRDALGLPDGVETFFDDGAAAALIADYEEALGESPLRIVELAIYSDYAFLEAQDPRVPTNVDRYSWRAGEVGEPDPESNRDDLDTVLFSTDEVAWDQIARLAAGSPGALGITDGRVSHIIVTRGSFGEGEPVIRVYVTSERDNGYLEARASTGEVLAGF